MIPDLKLQAAEKEKLEGSRISDEQHSIEVDELNQRIDQLEANNKKLKLELDERSRQQLKAKEKSDREKLELSEELKLAKIGAESLESELQKKAEDARQHELQLHDTKTENFRQVSYFCSTSLPLASSRRVGLTLSSLCPLF